MPITTVIIISLLLANLVLTLLIFWVVHDLLSTIKSLQDTEDVLKQALDLCGEQLPKHTEALKKVFDREDRLNNAFESGVNALAKSYDEIHRSYASMLKAFEERYSQSYEQFKHCSEKLKEISFQITDLANMSTEDEYTLTLHEACDTVCLECPYEDCKNGLKYEDKMLDCPIWKIKSNQREIEAELEETDEFLRWKARNEWTDDDYRDAANTHLEDIQEGTDDDK